MTTKLHADSKTGGGVMFEVQWEEFPLKYINNWTTESRHARATAAFVRATFESSTHGIVHRVVENPSGCVVAVFGSSGKRLTFPIAHAIAYAALAKAVAQP